MSAHDDDRLPLNFTTRDTSKPFRDAAGRLVPPRSNAPLLRGPDGAPRMDERMEAYLAEPHERGTRLGNLPVPLSFADAWSRLRAEEPPLAAAIEATVMRKQTLREAGTMLGVCNRTVRLRKITGLMRVMDWCGMRSPDDVEDALYSMRVRDRCLEVADAG